MKIFIAHNSRNYQPIDNTGAPIWEETPHSSPVAPPHSSHPPPLLSSDPSLPPTSPSIAPHTPNPSLFPSLDAPPPLSISGECHRSSSDFHGVRYCYIPIGTFYNILIIMQLLIIIVGNKTIALHYVIKNYVTTPLVMIIDDDVMLPHNLDMEGAYNKMQDDNMKAIAFTIRGIDDANISFLFFEICNLLIVFEYNNIWQSFQHLEYMQAGFVKIFQVIILPNMLN